jgi:hypothetical protein
MSLPLAHDQEFAVLNDSHAAGVGTERITGVREGLFDDRLQVVALHASRPVALGSHGITGRPRGRIRWRCLVRHRGGIRWSTEHAAAVGRQRGLAFEHAQELPSGVVLLGVEIGGDQPEQRGAGGGDVLLHQRVDVRRPAGYESRRAHRLGRHGCPGGRNLQVPEDPDDRQDQDQDEDAEGYQDALDPLHGCHRGRSGGVIAGVPALPGKDRYTGEGESTATCFPGARILPGWRQPLVIWRFVSVPERG